jgi:hypothetical protein
MRTENRAITWLVEPLAEIPSPCMNPGACRSDDYFPKCVFGSKDHQGQDKVILSVWFGDELGPVHHSIPRSIFPQHVFGSKEHWGQDEADPDFGKVWFGDELGTLKPIQGDVFSPLLSFYLYSIKSGCQNKSRVAYDFNFLCLWYSSSSLERIFKSRTH